MPRWLAALLVVFLLSTMASGWATTWMVIERAEEAEQRRREQIELVQGSQECILRLLLVEPAKREGFTVERILESCPDALPEKDKDEATSSSEDPDPGSRQPWEMVE